jgi:hypothetical protein
MPKEPTLPTGVEGDPKEENTRKRKNDHEEESSESDSDYSEKSPKSLSIMIA